MGGKKKVKIRTLKAFTIRNSETGNLTSIANGAIAEVSDILGSSLISDGLAEAYTLITPTGSIEITSNGTVDVAEYASAVVNVPDFKNLVNRSITSVTADMLGDISSIASYLFSDCDSLESIEIPNSVTRIRDHAFKHCVSLGSIEIPAGVILISDEAFSMCSALKSVTVLATNPPSLGQSVFGYAGIQAIYVPSESVDTYKAASGWSVLESKIQAIPND